MDSLDSVRRILIHRQRGDLAKLLRRTNISFDESSTYGSYLFSRLTTADVYAPLEDYERLRNLPSGDKNAILQALLEIHPPKAYEMEINKVEFYLATESLGQDLMTDEELIAEIEAQKNLMITVATGSPRIEQVNQEYKDRMTQIQSQLTKNGLRDPNPYSDLWKWYGKWSSGDLPTYKSRRNYVTDLYEPLLHRLRKAPLTSNNTIFEEPTGWVKVDRTLGEVRKVLESATSEEQFQTVGLLCRETLISLAQTVYVPSVHTTLDGVSPSDTDAKRMLEAYLVKELAGSTHEIARKHARAALDLANDLQHRRTATFRQAALSAEATASLVNLIAIISGQRDP